LIAYATKTPETHTSLTQLATHGNMLARLDPADEMDIAVTVRTKHDSRGNLVEDKYAAGVPRRVVYDAIVS